MSIAARFLAYAADFEKTYEDDDWERLKRHFSEDAVYEVKNVPFACRVEGRDAILAAMRKSIDGFDRKLDSREIAVTRGPVVEGNEIEMDWTVEYSKAGAPNFVLVGGSLTRIEDDHIIYLCDNYPDGVTEDAAAWVLEHAPDLDASYV